MFATSTPITAAGLTLRECGPATAPTICFLHGGGVSGWMWQPQVAAMQATYHCLIPDLPEHGLSGAVLPFTITESARRIADLILERAHGGRSSVIGLSEGAQITVQLLSVAAGLVERALVSSASVHPLPGAGLLGSRALALTYYLFVAPFKHNSSYIRWNMHRAAGIPDAYFDAFRQDFQRTTASSFSHMLMENQQFRLPKGLAHVQVPTLVIAGQHEYALMRRSAQDLVAALPHAQGYLLTFGKRAIDEHTWNLRNPELFNRVMRAWLTEQPLPDELVPLS